MRERFRAVVEDGRTTTYPYPVQHCGLCEFLPRCKEQWEHDDHLTLVAGVSRLQHDRLLAGGIRTMEALGAAPPGTRVSKIRPDTFAGLRHQAELQLHRRHTGEHKFDLLPQEPERGFALLPEPSPGDIWLDFEGHPWFEPARGLEYLFGWIELDEAGAPSYKCLWAHDRAGEKQALEQLVDYLAERRRRFPGLHVYHYAPYERSALTRLAGEHGTREEEVDDLLRGEVLVDLYRVTRQALRASVPSYSIKEVEALYEFERSADVSGGTESVEAFEAWLDTGDDTLLEGIRLYNEEDCVSTLELHRWLLGLRPAELPWRPPPEPTRERRGDRGVVEERERVRAALLAGAEEGEPDWLLAQLLDYHRREARPQWWAYFRNLELDDEELVDEQRDDRRPRARRRAGAGQAVARLHARRSRRRSTRSAARRSIRRPSRCYARHGRRRARDGDAQARRSQTRGRAAAAGLDPAASRCRRRRSATPCSASPGTATRYPALVDVLERRPPRAEPRRHARGSGAQPRPQLPLRPGAAGLGQDVAGARGSRSR